MTLNTLIIGAGAIGSLIGARLALSNHLVTFAARPSFVDAVRSRGLLFTDESGGHTVRNIRAVAGIEQAFTRAETAFDLAILTVKSYDTAAALDELRATLEQTGAPAPAMLSVQNGVGNEEAIAAAIPNVTVIAGSITTPVTVPAPGEIRVEKPRYGLGLGLWRGAPAAEIFPAVQELLGGAGFAVKAYASAEGMKWTKLLMNMLGNATCAILDEPPQVVFADSRMVNLEIAAWREALAVMRQAGIPAVNLDGYPFGLLAGLIRFAPDIAIRPVLRSQIRGARGGKMPSLHIDLAAGKRQNEVLWLNGAIVRRGASEGAPTPVNRLLTDTLLDLAAHPEQRTAWAGAHERLAAWR
jgi:2-dehydropantoate 2-reductase